MTCTAFQQMWEEAKPLHRAEFIQQQQQQQQQQQVMPTLEQLEAAAAEVHIATMVRLLPGLHP